MLLGLLVALGALKCVTLSPPPPLPKAIMQTMARKNEWPLDKMCLTIDVTKKMKEDYGHAPREGAYLHGLLLEGKAPRGVHVHLLHSGPSHSGSSWFLLFIYPISQHVFTLAVIYLISCFQTV